MIGGGKVAARKVQGLLEAKAKVTLIAPAVIPEIERLVDKGEIIYRNRGYQPGDLQDFFLIFGCTDEPMINQQVYNEAIEKGKLVNMVDDPEHCNFIVPATLRRGLLQVAISTSGASPALARELRIKLAEIIGDEYEIFLDLMSDLREIIKKQIKNEQARKILFEKLIDSDIFERLRQGKEQEALNLARDILDQEGIELDEGCWKNRSRQ